MKKVKLSILCLIVAIFAVLGLHGCGLLQTNSSSSATDLSELNFFPEHTTYTYIGAELRTDIRVCRGPNVLETINSSKEHSDFTVTYSDNVNVGTVTVTVTAKDTSKKYKGSGTCRFTIVGAKISVTNAADLKKYCENGNYAKVTVATDITVPDDMTVDIHQNTSLEISERLTVLGAVKSNGTVKLDGSAAILTNKGTFENNGSLQLTDEAVLYNETKFINNGSVDGAKNILSNSEIDGLKNYNFRRSVEDCDISLSYTSVDYTGKALVPYVSICANGAQVGTDQYTLAYQNNINAGTAKVIVTAKTNSSELYGEKEIEFTINRAKIITKNPEETIAALANENYCEVELKYWYVTDEITVPENVTLKLSAEQILSKITLYGNLLVPDTTTVLLQHAIENYGSIKIDGNLYLDADVKGGQVENCGKIYLYENGSLMNSTVVNEGKIYADTALNFIENVKNGSVVVRKKIEDSMLVLENSKVDFVLGPGRFYRPHPKFENKTVDKRTYKFSAENSRTEPTEYPYYVGTYNCTFTFNGNSEEYYGSAKAKLEIVQIEGVLTKLSGEFYDATQDFIDMASSGGYKKITLDDCFIFLNDLSYSGKVLSCRHIVLTEKCHFRVGSYTDKDFNGKPMFEVRMSLNTVIENYGSYSESHNGRISEAKELINHGKAVISQYNVSYYGTKNFISGNNPTVYQSQN